MTTISRKASASIFAVLVLVVCTLPIFVTIFSANDTKFVALRIIVPCLVCVCLAWLAILFIIQKLITKPICSMAHELSINAAQLSEALAKISSEGAQSGRAEGTSMGRAQRLEQSTRSLEKLASMAKQGDRNITSAYNLITEAQEASNELTGLMNQFNISIEEISEASVEVSGIIRTIQRLAAQTNILALNAAVEAARAGEQGATFSVVANEVRALATKVGEAAAATAKQVETIVDKVVDTSMVAVQIGRAADAVAENTAVENSVMSNIASVSREQTGTIEDIAKSLTELNQSSRAADEASGQQAAIAKQIETNSRQVQRLAQNLMILTSGR